MLRLQPVRSGAASSGVEVPLCVLSFALVAKEDADCSVSRVDKR